MIKDYVLYEFFRAPRLAGRIISASHQRYHALGGPVTGLRGLPTPQGGTMIRLPHRPVRYAPLLALATALFVPAAPASAAARVVNLDCTITVSNDLHPGLTPQLRHIAIVSHGLTGTATCTGTINGQPVTGPGRFGINDEIVGDCTQASGAGTFVLKIPTTGGTKTVAGRTTIVSAGGTTVHSGDLTGTSTVISVVGDCVTTPVTSSTAVLTVHVT